MKSFAQEVLDFCRQLVKAAHENDDGTIEVAAHNISAYVLAGDIARKANSLNGDVTSIEFLFNMAQADFLKKIDTPLDVGFEFDGFVGTMTLSMPQPKKETPIVEQELETIDDLMSRIRKEITLTRKDGVKKLQMLGAYHALALGFAMFSDEYKNGYLDLTLSDVEIGWLRHFGAVIGEVPAETQKAMEGVEELEGEELHRLFFKKD